MISELTNESSINSTISGSFRGSLVKIPSYFKNTLSTRSQGYRFPYTVSGEKDRQCPVVPLTHSSLKFIWRLRETQIKQVVRKITEENGVLVFG